MKKSIIACLLCLCAGFTSAQTRWYNPMQDEGRVVEGQGWYEELSGSYNRLPELLFRALFLRVYKICRGNATFDFQAIFPILRYISNRFSNF